MRHSPSVSILAMLTLLAPVFLMARPVHEQNAMVTSAHPEATQAGVEILKKGGNAIDAAVATALAISVVEPFMAGIGGGGFMLVHIAKEKRIRVLDFRELAPQLASADMYKAANKSSVQGHLAVAVPGTIAGLYEVHRKYGKVSWSKLFEPAMKLAKDGFKVGPKFIYAFNLKRHKLKQKELLKIFTKDGVPFRAGEILKQPEMYETLKVLSKNHREFYEGSISKAIVKEMSANKGLITDDDLRTYKVRWREPVCGEFRGAEICSMPPPSSGGILLLQMLNAVSEIGDEKLKWHEAKTVDALAQIMKLSFQDRAKFLGDPDFVDIPVEKLISRKYSKDKLKENLKQSFKESNDTSHLNVVDAERNAVSLTFTINLAFGAGIVAEGTGIVLNNEMDDFSSAPGVPNAFGLVGGSANAIAPKKIPLSSMTPVIARKNQEFYFAVGARGGSRIISTVFQSIMNHMVYGMNVQESLSAGRIHHQWVPNQIALEEKTLDPLTFSQLQKTGHEIKVEERANSNANMILATPTGGLDGAVDSRGFGKADGF